MFKFPLRKCYHAAKVTLVLILVVTILTLFEQWRGGKRSALAYSDPIEAEYEREILEDEARIIPGLGEGGIEAFLTGEDKKRGQESEKKLAMNVYLSERIAYNRTIDDHTHPACAHQIYDAELPSTSVIIIFHNEPYSVVVRTLWSVINSCKRSQPWFTRANYRDKDGNTMTLGYPGQDPSSPLVYLKEIILVDDNSTLPELKGKLSHYIRTRLPPDLIKILRLPERVGLTRARLAGARFATSSALVFLDAHCEASPDWLRPLLAEIKRSRHAVVLPIIDTIASDTFHYSVQENSLFQVGGFTFTGHFTWIDVPEREKKRRGSDIAPTWSPTMAGGLFAIDREYYWEVGAYDEQMAGWGGENLEMSFRIWQCGGTLETIPCSRVGHVFRSFHPYSMPASSDTHGINTARMAEVWMDEYAELFYLHRPDLRNNPKIGDVTHRRVLREKLHCKNFQWYLDHVYREKFVPVRDAQGYGRFKNPPSGLCIDTLQHEADMAPLGVYPCHAALTATQHFSLSLAGELRDEEKCAILPFKRASLEEDGVQVLMSNCLGNRREQRWRYVPSSHTIQHVSRGLCLAAGRGAGDELRARRCTAGPDQRWDIDYTEENGFRMTDGAELTEQEERLLKLRGLKRKSRSLMSVSSEKGWRRSHRKHKKRTRNDKNKFIIKLVRNLPNGTEEHLEVDIHCKHRQLYPNNSFVRDLVTILNDQDIKVINNGRVFERHRVVPLDNKPTSKLELPAEESTTTTDHPKKKSRGHHRADPPVVPSLRAAPPRAPPPALPAPSPAIHPLPDHRIIVEDFIETTTAKHKKRRKRPRGKSHESTEPPPDGADGTATPPVTDDDREWEQEVPSKAREMSGAWDRVMDDGNDGETWDAGIPHLKKENAHRRSNWVRAQEADNEVVPTTRRVQLKMHSNLTFNFEDTFFGKRADARPDARPDTRPDARPDARPDTRPDARPDTDKSPLNLDMSIPAEPPRPASPPPDDSTSDTSEE